MTDIDKLVEELRALGAISANWGEAKVRRNLREAADTLVSQRARILELEAQIKDWRDLFGSGELGR